MKTLAVITSPLNVDDSLSKRRREDFKTNNTSFELFSHNDLLLTKTLRYLVDAGLQECRLVCRQWSKVCNQLPVKLSGVPVEKVSQVPCTFPNAVELRCQGPCLPEHQPQVLNALARLSNLKHLDMTMRSLPTVPYAQLPRHFKELQQLETLCIRDTIPCIAHVCKALMHLTCLTKLDLRPTTRYRRHLEPITQLTRLKELHIYRALLANSNGELLFPPTRSLTCLEVDARGQYPAALPTELTPYSMWVQSLTLQLDTGHSHSLDWSTFADFKQLSALTVRGIRSDILIPHANSFAALKNATGLTRLDVDVDSRDHGSICGILATLTALRSLRVAVEDERAFPSHKTQLPFSHLSHLSALTLVNLSLKDTDVIHLTGLAELSLLYKEERRGEMFNSATQLTSLKTLSLCRVNLSDFPSTAFLCLTHLTTLSLKYVSHVDPLLFRDLADLPSLVELSYVHDAREDMSDALLNHLTLLTGLRCLTLDLGTEVDLLSVFRPGSFPRLNYLKINCKKLTLHQERSMYRRFPCLRSIVRITFV